MAEMTKRERVARAMWAAICAHADEIGMPVPDDTFNDLHPEVRKRQLRIARAAIEAHEAALAEAGFVVVPREASDDRRRAGFRERSRGMTLSWTQNKADMIARLLGAHVVPVIRGEEIVAIAVGGTAEIAQARADELIASRFPTFPERGAEE